MEGKHKPERVVSARVVSVSGSCAARHAAGDVVRFHGDRIEGRLCIHALYSMLPKVFALRYNADFPWLDEGTPATHACPDARNPVVFELKAEEEDK